MFKCSNYKNYEPHYINEKDIDTSFLKRVEVNYIRHELSAYEDNLEKLFEKTGKTEAL
ncbi:MAG: hypothetical protein ACTSPD_18045 [Promethearchaeota archaeon]